MSYKIDIFHKVEISLFEREETTSRGSLKIKQMLAKKDKNGFKMSTKKIWIVGIILLEKVTSLLET